MSRHHHRPCFSTACFILGILLLLHHMFSSSSSSCSWSWPLSTSSSPSAVAVRGGKIPPINSALFERFNRRFVIGGLQSHRSSPSWFVAFIMTGNCRNFLKIVQHDYQFWTRAEAMCIPCVVVGTKWNWWQNRIYPHHFYFGPIRNHRYPVRQAGKAGKDAGRSIENLETVESQHRSF